LETYNCGVLQTTDSNGGSGSGGGFAEDILSRKGAPEIPGNRESF